MYFLNSAFIKMIKIINSCFVGWLLQRLPFLDGKLLRWLNLKHMLVVGGPLWITLHLLPGHVTLLSHMVSYTNRSSHLFFSFTIQYTFAILLFFKQTSGATPEFMWDNIQIQVLDNFFFFYIFDALRNYYEYFFHSKLYLYIILAQIFVLEAEL